MKRALVELGEIYITSKGSLCRFEYFDDEIDEITFKKRVRENEEFSNDEQIFQVDVNCIAVNDFVENHPLFPLIVWDEQDIMFGFNPRYINKKLGW